MAANDRPFIAPRMRRFTASSTPNTRHNPRKCSVSAAGHTHGKSVTNEPMFALVSHPVGAPTSSPSAADLRMTNLASDRRGPSHRCQRQDRKQQD